MAKIRREVKNVFYNYTDAEVKVREATSNDPWGPSSTLMAELAEYTFHTHAYTLVMGMLWKRLNDHGKNWRHVSKSLVVLEYLVKSGSPRVVRQCKENLFSIETLKDFQFIDKDGKDQGVTVRDRAKAIVALVKDETRLKEERERAIQARERQQISGFGSDTATGRRSRSKSPRPPDSSERSADSPTTGSSSSVRFEPHVDQSRPSRREEEDIQLQLALRMSKEQAEEEDKLRKQEEESLRLALELSRKDTEPESGGGEEEKEDQEQPESSGGNLLVEFGDAGIGDPWAKASSEPPPPSYDTVTAPKNDPWASVPASTSDPFKTADPFASTAPASSDPWLTISSSSSVMSTSQPVLSVATGPFDLPPLDIGAPASSMPATSAGTAPFNMSSLGSTLPPLQPSKSNEASPSTERKPRVEESFLGDNAGLVNLDTLIAPLPPATGMTTNNPFGMTGHASPKLSNPFEANKPAAPSLVQLKQSQMPMFDPLPPPILPTGNQGSGIANNQSFNPFS